MLIVLCRILCLVLREVMVVNLGRVFVWCLSWVSLVLSFCRLRSNV